MESLEQDLNNLLDKKKLFENIYLFNMHFYKKNLD